MEQVITKVADLRDMDALLANIRPESWADMRMALGDDLTVPAAYDRLRERCGEARAAWFRGQVMMVYGVDPLSGLLGDDGLIWCLASKSIDQYPVRAMRAMRAWISGQHHYYTRLHSYVRMGYQRAIRWHLALGFRASGEMQLGATGALCTHFVREAT